MIGHVRSDLRNRGIGTYLMHWSQVQGRSLLADSIAEKRILLGFAVIGRRARYERFAFPPS